MKSSRVLILIMAGTTALSALSSMAVSAKVKTVTLMARTAGSEGQWYKAMGAAFEKAHPDIRVRIISAESAEAYDVKLMNMIIAGQAPDIWTNLGNSGFMDFMARKMALNLTPYVNRDKYDFKDFMTMAYKPFVIRGKVMGISHSTYSTITYYNTAMFSEAGLPDLPTEWTGTDWTWDKMAEYAKRLTKDRNNDGKTDQFGVITNFHIGDYGLPWQFGGELFNESVSRETGFPTKSTVNTPEVAKAYDAKADLMRKKVYGGDFRMKTCGILCDATWVLDSLTQTKKLPWSVAPLPAGPAGAVPTLYVDPWIVFSQSKNPDASWQVIKFMCSKEMQELWVDTTGRLPSRKSVMAKFLAKNPTVPGERLSNVLIGSFEVGRQSLWNFTVNSNSYIRALDPLVQRMWQGKLSVDQFVKQADDSIAKVIKTTGKTLGSL